MIVNQCLKCKRVWVTSDKKIPIEIMEQIKTNEYKELSHGFCKDCFMERCSHSIRKRQLNEGNFDCFGKAKDYCDQRDCTYMDVCVDSVNYIKID